MTTPLLTKDELATPQMWRAELDGKGINPASHYAVCLKTTKQAIATGRTVVVPVMTEAQAREAFYAWEDTKPRLFGSDIWLAALRHAGVLK